MFNLMFIVVREYPTALIAYQSIIGFEKPYFSNEGLVHTVSPQIIALVIMRSTFSSVAISLQVEISQNSKIHGNENQYFLCYRFAKFNGIDFFKIHRFVRHFPWYGKL